MNRAKLAFAVSLVALGAATIGAAAVSNVRQDADTAPSLDCAAMTGQSYGDVVIESATAMPNGTTVRSFIGTPMSLPAHCLVSGAIAKRTGADGKPYQIGFELRLPDKWNGRFLMQGGGGLDGVLSPATGGLVDNALSRGFAVVSTDFGHRDSNKPGESGDFGFDPQARIDYAFNAQDRVTVTAKKLVTSYYGKAPHHSYFNGCSGGGRQGMIMSQRFPTYYDGIVSGSPGMRLTDLSASAVSRYQTLAARVPLGANGEPDLSQALSSSELKLAADAVVNKCDALDGLKDGLIQNMRACSFDPRTLVCRPGQSAGCLSAAKVDLLKIAVGPAIDSKGRTVYPAVPWDSGIGDPAWRAIRLSGLPGQSTSQNMRSLFIAYQSPPSPHDDVYKITLDQWVSRAAEMKKLTDSIDPDLSAFRRHGGKILFQHGYSDQIMSANDLVGYYDQVAKLNGGIDKTQDFARMFLVPGMLHCFGGPGMTDFDALGAVVDWVEKNKAPDRLIASNPRLFPGRTRPLCPYPAQAFYKGGDPEKAESFECRK